jgi:glycosyltransferase involved in cell wall biosynthesis
LHRTTRLRDVRALRRLVHYLRDESIEIIHAHGTSLFIAAAAKPFAGGTRLIWHDHLGASMAARHRQRRLYRWAARRADHIITVSHLLERWADAELDLPADRITTIANFVLTGEGPAAGDASVELPGSAGRRVACVANLRRQKDHLMLLRAMAIVVASVPDAHALFVGAPIDRAVEQSILAEIEALHLERNVTLLGPRPDVALVLAGCDLGVLSSQSEGFPLALLEYGMAALPVVATDVGECDVILDHGAAGRVVDPGDHEAMAAAVVELLSTPTVATALGERLRRRVVDHYSADAVVGEVEAIYETALEDGR